MTSTASALPTDRSRTIADVVAVHRRWLYLPDETPLLVTLGAIAANMLEGDPVWLLLVGPPGSGKSEVLNGPTVLPYVHACSTLTEAALMSGTSKRESSGKGGLLREIGDRGILLCKDFGSVLSMNRDARAAVLAAMREIFDGSWTRHVGTDGGRTLGLSTGPASSGWSRGAPSTSIVTTRSSAQWANGS